MKPNKEPNISNAQFRTRQGFENLFHTYYEELCSYVFLFLREREASEEVVQDLFFNLWKKRDELEISTSLKAYLYRAARNQSLNLIRHIEIREKYKAQNEAERTAREQLLTEDIEINELEQRIARAIDILPAERQKIFIMSRYEDMKYREIAEKLNISVKTVEAQMGKALKTLREELADYLPLWLFILIFIP